MSGGIIKRHFSLLVIVFLSAVGCSTGKCNGASCETEEVGAGAINEDIDNPGIKPMRSESKAGQPSSQAEEALAEEVSDLSFDGSRVTGRVISTGCTSSEDFHVEHALADGTCQVTVIRDKQDFCRRAPYPMQISIPWEQPAECADHPVQFTNPTLKRPKGLPLKRLPDERSPGG